VDAGRPTGSGRRICILDSGIHATHEDLQGANIVGGEPSGWNSDGCGHGTHVTGTIAAVNNSIGVVGVAIAPEIYAVAALIWSSDPSKTNNEVRDAMNQSALDLGDAGRDNAYGYGLVQAYDAWKLLGGNGTGNVPPIASFTANCANLTCSFDAGASNDPDGSIVSYYWDFGDGASSSGLSPSHVFAAGSFSVTLTVTDDSGASGSLTQAVSAGTSTTGDFQCHFSKDQGHAICHYLGNGRAGQQRGDIHLLRQLLRWHIGHQPQHQSSWIKGCFIRVRSTHPWMRWATRPPQRNTLIKTN
jgi:PKD repeat protein